MSTDTLSKIREAIDALPEDKKEMALLGMELWGYAQGSNGEPPTHVKSALQASEVVRAKGGQHSLAFILGAETGIAIECNAAALNLTRDQLFDVIILVSTTIEDMFDLPADLPTPPETTEPETTDDDPDTDIPLGTIAGCPVTGGYSDDATPELYAARLTWQGLNVSTDGSHYLNIGPLGNDLDCVGDMRLAEWGKIRELAHTDVVEQLIMLARRKKTDPAD